MLIHLVSTSAVFNVFAVTCKGHDGETYMLPQLAPTRERAEAVAQKIASRGAINPDNWVRLTEGKTPVSVRGLFDQVKTTLVDTPEPSPKELAKAAVRAKYNAARRAKRQTKAA